MLKTRLIPAAAGAYQYPLLIKSLMLSGRRYEKSHEIVYRDQVRYSYATFNERVARLANVLSEAGVKAGDTVAVMDWDSHRYLECMFAIPMIGAVLHTINIRLSPEQILYTMNHAEDRFVLVNSEFVPLYQAVAGQLATVERTILLTDGAEKSAELPGLVGEYESLLAAASPRYDFPDFDENSIATTFYTTGTTGNPKGVYFSHRQLVLHTLAMASTIGSLDSIRLLGTSDVYMPITPMFHVHAWGTPYVATMLGVKQVYPGRYDPELLVELWKREKVTFSHCVPTILQMVMNARAAQGVDFKGWKVIIGGSALNRSLYEAAKARGIQLTAAYGMSETCPLISCAYLNDELLAGSEDERTTYRIKAGVPVPLVDAAIMDEQGRFLPADGESQGEPGVALAMADPGVFPRTRARRGVVARRLDAHRRRGDPGRHGLHRDPRPHQGRDQDRRRVAVLPGAGRPDQPPSGGTRSGGGRGARSAMGRAPVRPAGGARGPATGRPWPEGAPQAFRRAGQHQQVGDPLADRGCYRYSQDQRRQAGQEAHPYRDRPVAGSRQRLPVDRLTGLSYTAETPGGQANAWSPRFRDRPVILHPPQRREPEWLRRANHTFEGSSGRQR